MKYCIARQSLHYTSLELEHPGTEIQCTLFSRHKLLRRSHDFSRLYRITRYVTLSDDVRYVTKHTSEEAFMSGVVGVEYLFVLESLRCRYHPFAAGTGT